MVPSSQKDKDPELCMTNEHWSSRPHREGLTDWRLPLAICQFGLSAKMRHTQRRSWTQKLQKFSNDGWRTCALLGPLRIWPLVSLTPFMAQTTDTWLSNCV